MRHRDGSSFTLLTYLVIPLIACIVIFTTGWILVDSIYSWMAVSLTMIYVVLQVDSEKRHQEKEKNLNIESTTDTLTGLLNRRAYEEVLSGLKANDHVGVVYCDVNRLKYCNDNFGHTAGDELLRDFADVLKRVYKRQEIFRISGDEFVVVCADEHEAFEEKFASLENWWMHLTIELHPLVEHAALQRILRKSATGPKSRCTQTRGPIIRNTRKRTDAIKIRVIESRGRFF